LAIVYLSRTSRANVLNELAIDRKITYSAEGSAVRIVLASAVSGRQKKWCSAVRPNFTLKLVRPGFGPAAELPTSPAA
jgi:hypothetical protein